jgi:16S rRNA (guanine966-N2)-methyltransferase
MRIIGGIYKGRMLHPGRNFRARPTTDLAKEGLFNILENRISFQEVHVLDLFSGTGSISFEFASRGCEQVTLIEKDPFHYAFIIKTLKKLGITTITPVKTDVFRYLKNCRMHYDVVFADPPYDLKELATLPDAIFASGMLTPGSLFILEHPKTYHFQSFPFFLEQRNYGSVRFSFFRKE